MPSQLMSQEDAVHILSGILLRHKKDEIMLFAATCMKLEIITLSKRYRERHIYDMAYMQNLKEKRKIQMNLRTKQKQTHRQTTNLWLPNGKGWRGIN